MVTKILQARRAAGITQHEIARAIGKTTMWLSLAERGLTPVSPEMEQHILTLVHRLSWLNETVARKREELVSDVRQAAAR
jgi:transcriptional regulator with XRE-family HTH domain